MARSRWSSVWGIPLAAIGLVFSLLLASALLLALGAGAEGQPALASRALVLLGAALGVDLVLAGLQAFAVKVFCALCAATYVLNAAAFALLLPARKALRGAGAALRLPENRVVIAGLVLAGVAWTMAVSGLEVALTARKAMRTLTLLGSPAGPASPGVPALATPPPAAGGSGGPGDGDRWRTEAQRLQ